ncbi:MAG: dihydropteroate synthase [Candidatus Fimenecus sp.]
MYFFRGKDFSFPINTHTYIMGILNVTPDSFFDGGKWNSPQIALTHALEMERDGADLLDIGAQSTRPGHTPLSDAQELQVLQQFLPLIAKQVHIPISVDTFYPLVAEYALQNGAQIINDVSGVFSEQMAEVVKRYHAGWIVMHSGNSNSDTVAEYPNGVTQDVLTFFDRMQEQCEASGIMKEQLCFDMGIGFGKSHADNLELIRNVSQLKREDRALLTALSCKRVVANETGADGDDRLYGTVAADTLAIAGGTDFIRVHHVRESVFAAKMADALLRERKNG